jgi:hypothetical protein
MFQQMEPGSLPEVKATHDPTPPHPRVAPYVFMVLAALAARLAAIAFLYPEQLDPFRDHWRFAYEAGRVARSLAQGQGFSNPLYEPTGPTAWFTPLFPCLLAAVFKLFGIYSKASALVMLSLDGVISALTCVPVFFIARHSFGQRAALWAGWLWAFSPYGIYFPAERIWETWLATLLLCLIFLLALQLENSASLGLWAGYGLLWALAALNSPVALSVLPVLTAWICYRLRRQGRAWLRPAAVSTLVFAAAVSLWFVRNYQTFHEFVPFRDTLGLELYVGNNGDTSHWHPNAAGPWHNDAEYAEYQQLGELNYMARKKHQAVQFISHHPGLFLLTSLRRAGYLWTGFWSLDRNYLRQEPLDLANIPFLTTLSVLALLGLVRAFRADAAAAAPYAIVLVFFPAIYYVTHPEVYYLRPLDPIVAILAASLVQSRQKVQGA